MTSAQSKRILAALLSVLVLVLSPGLPFYQLWAAELVETGAPIAPAEIPGVSVDPLSRTPSAILAASEPSLYTMSAGVLPTAPPRLAVPADNASPQSASLGSQAELSPRAAALDSEAVAPQTPWAVQAALGAPVLYLVQESKKGAAPASESVVSSLRGLFDGWRSAGDPDAAPAVRLSAANGVLGADDSRRPTPEYLSKLQLGSLRLVSLDGTDPSSPRANFADAAGNRIFMERLVWLGCLRFFITAAGTKQNTKLLFYDDLPSSWRDGERSGLGSILPALKDALLKGKTNLPRALQKVANKLSQTMDSVQGKMSKAAAEEQRENELRWQEPEPPIPQAEKPKRGFWASLRDGFDLLAGPRFADSDGHPGPDAALQPASQAAARRFRPAKEAVAKPASSNDNKRGRIKPVGAAILLAMGLTALSLPLAAAVPVAAHAAGHVLLGGFAGLILGFGIGFLLNPKVSEEYGLGPLGWILHAIVGAVIGAIVGWFL